DRPPYEADAALAAQSRSRLPAAPAARAPAERPAHRRGDPPLPGLRPLQDLAPPARRHGGRARGAEEALASRGLRRRRAAQPPSTGALAGARAAASPRRARRAVEPPRIALLRRRRLLLLPALPHGRGDRAAHASRRRARRQLAADNRRRHGLPRQSARQRQRA